MINFTFLLFQILHRHTPQYKRLFEHLKSLFKTTINFFILKAVPDDCQVRLLIDWLVFKKN